MRTMEVLHQHPDQMDEARATWERISRAPAQTIRAFLRAYYSSTRGARPPSKGLYRAFKDQHLPDRAESEQRAEEVVDFLRGLGSDFDIYRKLQAGEWPYEGGTASAWYRGRLERLVSVLGTGAVLPLLMSIAVAREEAVFAECVVYLDKYLVRYNICRGHRSTLGDSMFTVAGTARAGDAFDLGALKSGLARTGSKYASEVRFRSALATIRYGSNSGRLLAHLLTTLDDYFAWLNRGGDGPPTPSTEAVFDLAQCQVEHIYPQAGDGESNPTLERVKHNLGNLTFLAPGDNRDASNKSFDFKKEHVYKDSRAAMTKALADLDSWDERAFTQRETQLVDLSLRVFEIEVVAEAEGSEREDSLPWFVQQDPGSGYRDVAGVAYEYPRDNPNALNVRPGDVLVTFLGSRHARHRQRVTGAGRIGMIVPDGDHVLALYDRYFAFSPPLTFAQIGGDARANRQHAINPLPQPALDTILETAGLGSIEDAAVVETDPDAFMAEHPRATDTSAEESSGEPSRPEEEDENSEGAVESEGIPAAGGSVAEESDDEMSPDDPRDADYWAESAGSDDGRGSD